MPELTREYIEDHLHHVHTPDSFARSLTYAILQSAKKSAGPDQAEISVPCNATVSPIEKLGCIQICVETPFGTLCHHVNV